MSAAAPTAPPYGLAFGVEMAMMRHRRKVEPRLGRAGAQRRIGNGSGPPPPASRLARTPFRTARAAAVSFAYGRYTDAGCCNTATIGEPLANE